MTKRFAFVLCASFGLMSPFPVALAQVVEWDLDAESGAERTAHEEALERLLRAPMDLWTASEDDLLQIPGMRRREASAILAAVKERRIVEVRAIDLIPGVRRGTAERIAPYVVLSVGNAFAKLNTRLRSTASLRDKDGNVEILRRQLDVRIDGSHNAQSRESLRMEFRRSGSDPSAWFSYARIPGPFAGWSIAFGDLEVRSGSALLDAGRRTSLQRRSDWERRLLPDARILPGYDPGTAGRGAALQAISTDRVMQASLTTDETGGRWGMISWTEEWPFGMTTQAVRDLRTPGTSFRVEAALAAVQVSVEASLEARAASFVASFRWEERGSYWLHGVARRLRGLAAPGVPRVGDRNADEVGAGLSMQHVLSKRFRWHVVGDVGRVEETGRVPEAAWPSFTLGVGSVVQLERRSSVGVEWMRTSRDGGRMRRGSLRLDQRLSERIRGMLLFSHRTEHTRLRGAVAGVVAMATASWESTEFSAHIRWTTGDGDPAVEFWSLGPGPSILGGLQRIAGRMGEIRGVVQWQPTRAVETGIAVSWKLRPTKELRTSILLEIHL